MPRIPVGLVLGATAAGDPSGRLAAVEGSVLEAFHDDPADLSPDRVVRLSAALAAAGVVAVTARRRDLGDRWRDPLVAACIDALGRPAPDRPEGHP